MKLLEIRDSLGYYLDDKDGFATVDKLTKEDLLRLVNLTLEENDVEFDEYDGEVLKNQAHRIIYRSIFEKLQGLRDRREEFKDESERLYLSEYERYRDEVSQPAGALDGDSAAAPSPQVT